MSGTILRPAVDTVVTKCPRFCRANTGMAATFGLAPEAVAEAVAFAIEQPHDVEIGDITIRPTVQN